MRNDKINFGTSGGRGVIGKDFIFPGVGSRYWLVRLNMHVWDDIPLRVSGRVKADYQEFAGRRVGTVDRKGGLKLVFEDGESVFRPSGTAPLVRIYSESDRPAKSVKVAAEARDWVNQ